MPHCYYRFSNCGVNSISSNDRTSPTAADIKRLFALSGNRCSFARCTALIVCNGVLLGEICHIHAASPRGPRYNTEQTASERHGFDNLILLCCNHHKVIDDDWETYTADRLRKIKFDHELKTSPMDEMELERNIRVLLNANVLSSGQTGGITAHSISAGAIYLGSPPPRHTTDRQNAAIEKMWQSIVGLKRELAAVVVADQVLTSSELAEGFAGRSDNFLFDSLQFLRDPHAVTRILQASGINEAENERPFVSARQYELYTAAYALLARSALLITLSFKDGTYRDWRDDSLVARNLQTILPKVQLENLRSGESYTISSVIELFLSAFLGAGRQ